MRYLLIAALAVVLVGCHVTPPVAEASPPPTGLLARMFDSGQDYSVLLLIAGMGSLLSFGSVIAWSFGIRLPVKTTLAGIACAVGAWTLRALLIGYLWLFVLLAVAAALLGLVALYYSYRFWIEKRTGLDLNHDGTIGKVSKQKG